MSGFALVGEVCDTTTMPTPTPLTVFIDEAGDPGVKDGVHYYAKRYEWLTIGAAVVRSERDSDLVRWVKDLRAEANSWQSVALHYARITPARRAAMCAKLATYPVRGFCLLSHKSNMREYINPKLGKMDKQDIFYNWCVRLTLERVMEWCAGFMMREFGNIYPLRIVYSARGGHPYGEMFDYFDKLNLQHSQGRMKLKPRFWSPEMLDRTHYEVVQHNDLAGLQLADVIASAFLQGANVQSSRYDTSPAIALEPIMPKDGEGKWEDFSVTVWPLRGQAEIPRESQPLFRHYGYNFSR